MSGRRLTPTPGTVQVGGAGDPLAPPEEVVLASTDPDEVTVFPSPVGGEPEEPRRKEPEPEEELSPEEQVMFASLLTCGRRTKTIHLFDHTVVVQTLCCDDDLRIGLFVKTYTGSLGEQRAYQVGVVAAGLRSINGQPLVQSLFEQAEPGAVFDAKVVKVIQMYPTVLNKVYRAVMDAEKEFVELATRLGKLDG